MTITKSAVPGVMVARYTVGRRTGVTSASSFRKRISASYMPSPIPCARFSSYGDGSLTMTLVGAPSAWAGVADSGRQQLAHHADAGADRLAVERDHLGVGTDGAALREARR